MVTGAIKTRFAHWLAFGDAASAAQCITISEREAYTLPRNTREIRILSGTAWVSHLREDQIVKKGETLRLQPHKGMTVITSTGRYPVQLEIY